MTKYITIDLGDQFIDVVSGESLGSQPGVTEILVPCEKYNQIISSIFGKFANKHPVIHGTKNEYVSCWVPNKYVFDDELSALNNAHERLEATLGDLRIQIEMLQNQQEELLKRSYSVARRIDEICAKQS